MNRRRFCCAMGAIATAATRPTGVPLLAAFSHELHARTAQALGTTVKITVRHASPEEADVAMAAALKEVSLVESLMSIYRGDSQISQLNRHGVLKAPHPYVVELLKMAQRTSRQTNGAFDVTVQPLWQLHKECFDRGELPSPGRIELARRRMGRDRIEIGLDCIQVKRGTQITLNGIAQGFATDCAKRVLQEQGIKAALIDIGEIAGLGRKNHEQAWRVGIQHPRKDDAFLQITPLQDRCLATSGDYQTAFTADFRSHHIFDPSTGRSPTELSSVSILAPTATLADALSTSVFVLGAERGAEYLSAQKGVDALLVHKDGRVQATPGFPAEAMH